MAIKWKNNKTEKKDTEKRPEEKYVPVMKDGRKGSMKGILVVFVCVAIAATIMCSAYSLFRGRAKALVADYEKQYEEEQEAVVYEPDEMFKRYLLSSVYYMNYEMTPDMDAYTYFTQNYDMSKFTEAEQNRIKEAAARLMQNMRNQYSVMQSDYSYGSFGSGPARDFGGDGYLSSAVHGNSEDARQYYQSGLVIQYDSRGVPNIRESWGLDLDETDILGYLQQASMTRLMDDNGMGDVVYGTTVYYDGDAYVASKGTVSIEELETTEEFLEEVVDIDLEEEALRNDQLLKSIPVPVIQNTSFVFAVHSNENNTESWKDYWRVRSCYMRSGYSIGVMGIVAAMALLALVLQNIPIFALRKNRLFRLPTELVAFAGIMGFLATGEFVLSDFGLYTMTTSIVEDFESIGFGNVAPAVSTIFIWLCWFCFAFCWYWGAASVLPYLTHPIRSLQENMLCVRVCVWMKDLWLRLWHWATDVDLDENLTRKIWKVVGLNGVVASALCCIWVGGIVGAMIYTILLYILIKKKCWEIQENYERLLQVTRTIAEGDLNASTEEDMGVFNPIRDELTSIRNGFRRAVNDEVRSRNMKTELITNVSHDLKTPLTAIITYVDLLKKEDITEEQRKEYINTLDKKSQRLKVLIEDLFEVSKATSDNIVMNFDDVDLVSLIKQVRLENEDKIQESALDFRWNLLEEKCILTLDPQRTFRVIDNLVQNILKYSMPHSRVYIDMKDRETEVVISFKNMSAAEMNFSPEEITERFVRGDLSRNTEGSGLGLAIAQSFTELQNGTFQVETDGDLFKVTICWKK